MIRKYAGLCLLLLAVGCASKGTITGTVSYQGKPIPEGSVMFIPEGGGPVATGIINDGKYTAEKVPVGPAKVAITSLYNAGEKENAMAQMIQGGGKGGGPPPGTMPEEARQFFSGGGAPKKGLKIPEKYSDLKNSPLTYTVTGGSQTKDFNLD